MLTARRMTTILARLHCAATGGHHFGPGIASSRRDGLGLMRSTITYTCARCGHVQTLYH